MLCCSECSGKFYSRVRHLTGLHEHHYFPCIMNNSSIEKWTLGLSTLNSGEAAILSPDPMWLQSMEVELLFCHNENSCKMRMKLTTKSRISKQNAESLKIPFCYWIKINLETQLSFGFQHSQELLSSLWGLSSLSTLLYVT